MPHPFPVSLNENDDRAIVFIQKAAAGKKGGSRLFFGFRANRDFRGM
jgi:hypothetical protein